MAEYTPALDTVVSRELSWLGVDPAPGWTTNPPPNLLNTSSPPGPLDLVSAYIRYPLQRFRALYINRVRVEVYPPGTMEGEQIGGGFGAQYAWRHSMVALLTWDFETATGELDVEAQALDTAIAAIEWRLRGPVGDKTHGQQFLAAGLGDSRDLIDIRIGNGREDALETAMQTGDMLRVTFSYPLYDIIVG